MNNYYNELSQLSILEQEINRFATSLQNKKAGCFTHRFEALLNVLPNEFRNQVNFRNKIQDYIKKSNYEKDIKDYVLQVFLSFFEPIEIKVPNSLRNVVEKNESYNKAMIEGHNNFKSANNYTQSQEPQNETSEPEQPEKQETEQETIRYTAKHYVLAYLIECNAKGESFPIGQKKELEKIGNEKMGTGKGNRFYKVFNEVINKDLNAEKNLFEIGGEYWRKAVIELSKAPELVENYLQSKQL